MLLSIIIPAYNVAEYIEKALNSVLEQKPGIEEEFEIIVVNDGSKDETESKLAHYRNNLIQINQSNQGVSAARNAGIKVASGKFLLFLDADDTLESGSLFEIVNYVKNCEDDLVILGYQKINEQGEIKYRTALENYHLKQFKELESYYQLIGENSLMADTNRCWGVIYKSEKVKQIHEPFPIGVPYLEDAAFLAKYLVLTEVYSVLNLIVCTRLMRSGSAVNSNLFVSERAIHGFDLALNDLANFEATVNINKLNVKDRLTHLNQTIIKFATLRLISAINSGSKELLDKTIKMVEQNPGRFAVAGVRYPFNIWGPIYRKSVLLFIIVFKLHARLRFIKSKFFKG